MTKPENIAIGKGQLIYTARILTTFLTRSGDECGPRPDQIGFISALRRLGLKGEPPASQGWGIGGLLTGSGQSQFTVRFCQLSQDSTL